MYLRGSGILNEQVLLGHWLSWLSFVYIFLSNYFQMASNGLKLARNTLLHFSIVYFILLQSFCHQRYTAWGAGGIVNKPKIFFFSRRNQIIDDT
jgi:hypothetical protein